MKNLDTQQRFRGCLLGLAIGNAVGATAAFMPRGSFNPITGLVGGGRDVLQPGQWTGATSTALCLAESLIAKLDCDPKEQMERYLRWYRDGYNSCTGKCLDISDETRGALEQFEKSGSPYADSTAPHTLDNGSIARLAPVPLFYYPDIEAVIRFAGESSKTTHPAGECIEACHLFSIMLAKALEGRSKEEILLGEEYVDRIELSEKLEKIASGSYVNKSEDEIHGTTNVFESLEAALWCFHTTDSFQAAVLKAANLGDAADTTAAVCGQIAGAFYGHMSIPAEWREQVDSGEKLKDLAEKFFTRRLQVFVQPILGGRLEFFEIFRAVDTKRSTKRKQECFFIQLSRTFAEEAGHFNLLNIEGVGEVSDKIVEKQVASKKWRPLKDHEAIDVVFAHIIRELLEKGDLFSGFLRKGQRQHGWIDARAFLEANKERNDEGFAEINGNIFHFSPDTLSKLEGIKDGIILALTGSCFYRSEVCHWILDEKRFMSLSYSELDEGKMRKSFKRSGWVSSRTKSPINILSNKYLLKSIATDAPALTTELLEELELWQVLKIKNEARKIITRNLCNFTYRESGNSRLNLELPRWIQQIIGPATHDSLVATIETIKDVSPESGIVSRCETFLIFYDQGSFDRFAEEYAAVNGINRVKTADGADALPVFLFDFYQKSSIIGVQFEDIPEGLLSDIPWLDPSKIEPIFLHAGDAKGDYLGLFYKRITTAFVRITSYALPKDMGLLHLAHWDRDCGAEDLNLEFLKTLLSRRTPHHERRVLQLAGVPCRQALDDSVSKKLNGLRPTSDVAIALKDRDRALALAVKSYIDFSTAIKNSALDDLLEVLNQEEEKGMSSTEVLPGMCLLSKIAENLHQLPANVPIEDRIDTMTKSFNMQGQYLAASLCETLLNAWGKTHPEKDSHKDVIKKIVRTFWAELRECFPDDNTGQWASTGDKGDPQSNTRMTRYTAFILSTIFDRPRTTFYEKAQPLPYEILDWAMASVMRLHLLSAVLPMCCGDWACLKRYDNPGARKISWRNRNFALFRKEVDYTGDKRGGKIPKTQSGQTGTAWCADSRCKHAPDSAPLLSICATHFTTSDIRDLHMTVGKMGWWMNGVLSMQMHKHFRCSKCGGFMVPDFKNPSFNYFNCGQAGTDHDKIVYLSWCIGKRCPNVIDSRLADKRCSKGKIICRKCGMCCWDHMTNLAKLKVEPSFVCRSCSRIIPEPNELSQITPKGLSVQCGGCDTENVLFPADLSAKRLSSLKNAAIQGPLLDGGTSINTRTLDED